MAYSLESSLGYQSQMASRAIGRRLVERFEAHGLPYNSYEWQVITFLFHEDGQNQQTLANKCGKDKAGITRIVDHLEQQGLLKRQTDPRDRRSNSIRLTTKGRQVFEKLAALAEETLNEAMSGIDAHDLEVCIRVLKQSVVNLDSCEPPAVM